MDALTLWGFRSSADNLTPAKVSLVTLLLSCQSLSKGFGGQFLFEDLSLSLFEGDRVGLIGPNGSGKSTLLKILAGMERPDLGELSMQRGLKVGYVPQSCQFDDLPLQQILAEVVSTELPDYERELLVATWLSKLGFTGKEKSAAALSGGWKKRLAIAKELIQGPDLLLLDEPTNHLDLDGVIWLEKFLVREAPTYLLVSHDRFFLENSTSRIIELDRIYPKGMLALDGSYSHFLEKKQELLKGQLSQERSIASKARKELAWLRESPKARTTKSRSRVEDAHETLEELAAIKRRNRVQRTSIEFAATERETRKLLVAHNLGKSIGDRPLFRGLNFTLSPGSRMGLMGPNGSGKTTLLKLLLGALQPDQGTMKRADELKAVYFDQHRMQLPENISLRDALSPTGDYVTFRGERIHVNGWCQRFLFSPERLDLPIGVLSGGERARIVVAHLMLEPADLLLLDEPTNDLDIPTLETLESSLMEFPGAVVLITHDRCMLDRICNSFLALGDPDQAELYADYSQWEAAHRKRVAAAPKTATETPPPPPSPKLSYAEKRECSQIETAIAKIEAELKSLHRELERPELADSPVRLQELCTAIGLAETQLERLYLRWEELSKRL